MVAVPLTGVDGNVQIAGTVVENLREWSWEPTSTVVKVGGFGTKWEYKKPSVIDAKGTCKGIHVTGGAGQLAVQTAFSAQTEVALTLGATATEHVIQPAYITSLKSMAKYDGTTDFEFGWEAAGEPTTYFAH